MKDEYQFLDVSIIEFDTENPRIKMALEKYGDAITAERIHFALRSASDDSNATSTFSRLRDSIRAHGGITQPITVVIEGDKQRCIDGNTRLAIYRDFLNQEADGNWKKIRALVMQDALPREIETIRVSAHLVGSRPWPAYEKARYLHYLYHAQFMQFDEMVALCGGNKQDIERQIDAYNEMNQYYRDIVDDTAFHIDRFSGFVELQRSAVKDAIFEAGFDLEDFGGWIRDGNIRRLADVRQLTKVLQNKKATDIFVKGGVGSIEQAVKYIDREKEATLDTATSNLNLGNAPLHLLAQVLSGKINNMPFSTLQLLQEAKSDQDVETVQALEDLFEHLDGLLANVRK